MIELVGVGVGRMGGVSSVIVGGEEECSRECGGEMRKVKCWIEDVGVWVRYWVGGLGISVIEGFVFVV